MTSDEPSAVRALDLRLVPPAALAWGAGFWAVGVPASASLTVGGAAALSALLLGAWLRRRVRLRRPAAPGLPGAGLPGAGLPGAGLPGAGLPAAGRVGAAAAALAACAAVLLSTAGQVAVRDAGLLADLVRAGATVTVAATVADDPAPVQPDPARSWGTGAPRWVVEVDVHRIGGRGVSAGAAAPLLVVGGSSWAGVQPGARVRVRGRLVAAERGDRVLALLVVRDGPVPVGAAPAWQRAAQSLRGGLRDAARPLPPDAGGLLPGLVVGDTSRLPPDLEEAMQRAGLTHLTAVSGSNVAIVCGTTLLMAGACGAGRRARVVLAAATLVGFVVLARPDPSVLRAAVMGGVGLVGLATARPRRGVPALCGAVVVLTVVDPWLSRTFGFALSVLATGALLVLARPWAEALGRWLPAPLALAVAVPAAAQAVCAPVVVLLTPALAMMAVPANMLVAPAIAPATVLGVLATVVAPLWPGGAVALAWLAGWGTAWIAVVARTAAALPGASLPWPEGQFGAVLLCVLTVLAAVLVRAFAAHRRRLPDVGQHGARDRARHRVTDDQQVGPAGFAPRRVLLASAVLALVVALALQLTALPLPWMRGQWPPPGWRLVACDVGQGDAVVASDGAGSAILIDVGPEPDAVDRCLDRLRVERVGLLVLTHFHADHVDGLAGALDGRRVDAALVSPLRAPEPGAERALAGLAAAGIPVTTASTGRQGVVGGVRWRVVWPTGTASGAADPGEDPDGSVINDSSVVLLLDVAGVTVLSTGDVEPGAQSQVRRLLRDQTSLSDAFSVDVLKVAHHGSAHQDAELNRLARPRLALISVGAANDYGHPARSTLRLLEGMGAQVARTDQLGDVAVGLGVDGSLWVAGARGDPRPGRGRRRRRRMAGSGRGSPQHTQDLASGGTGARRPGHRDGGAARGPCRRNGATALAPAGPRP